MFGFSSSRLVLSKSSNNSSLLISIPDLATLHFDLLLLIRCFSSAKLNWQSFTVSYLINSCGLCPTSAESISKKICLKSKERPDSVLMLLKNHGFTNTHISKLVKKAPKLLLAQPDKSLLPKIEFLRSIGVSNSDLSVIVCRNTEVLLRSLNGYLVPRYHILKSALDYDDKVIKTLKRISMLSMQLMPNTFNINLSLLRGIGIPQSSTNVLVTNYPSVMCLKVGKFAEAVKKVVELGFDPSKIPFIKALHVFCQLSDKTWEHKMEVYRRWGFSKDEFWSIFRKHPTCMSRSEKNLVRIMNFLVCKMGWKPANVVSVPVVICCSLERRIMPRCLVARILLLKGLIKSDICLSTVLIPSEENFLDRFVIKHQEQVPQLLDLFQGKIGLEQLGFTFDEKSGILCLEGL